MKEFIDCWKYWEKYLADDAEFITVEQNILAFYSQSFSPEMIIEYFEGWGRTDLKDIYKNEIYNYKIVYLHYPPNDGGNKKISIRTDTYFIELLLPKTLSQFITNCKQANINLTWKELK